MFIFTALQLLQYLNLLLLIPSTTSSPRPSPFAPLSRAPNTAIKTVTEYVTTTITVTLPPYTIPPQIVHGGEPQHYQMVAPHYYTVTERETVTKTVTWMVSAGASAVEEGRRGVRRKGGPAVACGAGAR